MVAFCGAVVRARIWVAAALIALAGCGQQNGQSTAPAAETRPDPTAALRAAASDPPLARFYGARGSPPGGRLGRARPLGVTREGRRGLERAPPATRIDVNTGAAPLTYWRDGRAADSRRVVVGEPGRETPELGSPLYRLVANPT